MENSARQRQAFLPRVSRSDSNEHAQMSHTSAGYLEHHIGRVVNSRQGFGKTRRRRRHLLYDNDANRRHYRHRARGDHPARIQR